MRNQPLCLYAAELLFFLLSTVRPPIDRLLIVYFPLSSYCTHQLARAFSPTRNVSALPQATMISGKIILESSTKVTLDKR